MGLWEVPVSFARKIEGKIFPQKTISWEYFTWYGIVRLPLKGSIMRNDAPSNVAVSTINEVKKPLSLIDITPWSSYLSLIEDFWELMIDNIQLKYLNTGWGRWRSFDKAHAMVNENSSIVLSLSFDLVLHIGFHPLVLSLPVLRLWCSFSQKTKQYQGSGRTVNMLHERQFSQILYRHDDGRNNSGNVSRWLLLRDQGERVYLCWLWR